ncbi:MAG: PTS mannose/fructose/sorbose transporter family subunit IID [Candidatus Eisenbacteria bacterium]|uniref:PTS mannose/fructose/sorbose transporter family subunit IID n=1 Tax=Eiseniibacteriota bacterium TaxID=2212470 RepID=A0A849SUN4_UNCEI|nr:PTS mannose/fructose/sorbose transporter family subunit IID [Candidatus Eisenbacteria bacterium]
MAKLTAFDLGRSSWRTHLLQALWNYERQQGIGWAFAIEPLLERLIPDASERRARLAEHTAYFNTQPTLASLAVGAVAALEERRAAGEPVDADAVARTKAVLGSALAAVGDRFFWFTLRPFAGLLGIALAAGGSRYGALALWLAYNAFHLPLRHAGVGIGYREGPAVLGGTLRARIESVMRNLSLAGCALAGVVVALLLAPGGNPRPAPWQAALLGGMMFGLLAALRSRPSPTQWALGLGALCLIVGWRL